MILPVLSTSVALLPRVNVMRVSSGGVRKSRYSDDPLYGLLPAKPDIRPVAPPHRPWVSLYRPTPRAMPDAPLYRPVDTAYALLSPD